METTGDHVEPLGDKSNHGEARGPPGTTGTTWGNTGEWGDHGTTVITETTGTTNHCRIVTHSHTHLA